MSLLVLLFQEPWEELAGSWRGGTGRVLGEAVLQLPQERVLLLLLLPLLLKAQMRLRLGVHWARSVDGRTLQNAQRGWAVLKSAAPQ